MSHEYDSECCCIDCCIERDKREFNQAGMASMSKDQKEICMYCKAWFWTGKLEENLYAGECRNCSPKTFQIGTGADFRTKWPPVLSANWCLEFKERNNDD